MGARSAIAEARSAASATLRVNVPTASSVALNTLMPAYGIAPVVGLNPTTPQYAAGRTADPDDEPPGVCSRFHGFFVLPACMNANSVVTVLPNTNPPACLMRATHCASCSGRWPAYTGEPICVGSSEVAMMSLTPMPQPASAPRACCESQRCASSRTCAASRCAHASIASSVASMRASCDTANAGAAASPEAIARSGRRKRSVLMPSLCLVRAARDGQCHDARLCRGPRTLRRPQEDRLQIVQESTAALGGLQYCRVGVEEAARDRLRDLALDRREREAGPLGEQRCGRAFGEPKRIQHELEARVVAR